MLLALGIGLVCLVSVQSMPGFCWDAAVLRGGEARGSTITNGRQYISSPDGTKAKKTENGTQEVQAQSI